MAKRAGTELFVSSCESNSVFSISPASSFQSVYKLREHHSLGSDSVRGYLGRTVELHNQSAPGEHVRTVRRHSTRLVADPRTKKPKGFGFVRFQSEADAQKAIKGLNGRIVDGRLIFVEVAKTSGPGEDQS